MARVVLVHGTSHGAWCWRDLVPELAAFGHEPVAIDLPSHGEDRTPVGEVGLDDYARAVLGATDPGDIVVAHSMGGFPATRAAMLDPGRIGKLIYLCAYVPIPGMTLADMRRLSERQPLVEAIRREPGGVTITIDPAMAPAKFYQDCPPETAAWATSMLCPQAIRPMETPFPDGPLPDLPRAYILCEEDGAVPVELQERFSAGWDEVARLPTGHSPFLSDPALLARTIQGMIPGA